jgi:hypothetical protein
MLRWTYRLRDHLASHGYALHCNGGYGGAYLRVLAEAEFDDEALLSSNISMPDNAAGYVAMPPAFDLMKLQQSMASRDIYDSLHIERFRSEEDRIEFTEHNSFPWDEDKTVEILWLSPTDFVSTILFNEHDHYKQRVWMRDESDSGGSEFGVRPLPYGGFVR